MFYRLMSRILGIFDVIVWTFLALFVAGLLLWGIIIDYWNPKLSIYIVATWIMGIFIIGCICHYLIFCSVALTVSTMGKLQEDTNSRLENCKTWQESSWSLFFVAIHSLYLFFDGDRKDCFLAVFYVFCPLFRIFAPFCVYKYSKELKLIIQNSDTVTETWAPSTLQVQHDLSNANETRVARLAKRLFIRNKIIANSGSASFDENFDDIRSTQRDKLIIDGR